MHILYVGSFFSFFFFFFQAEDGIRDLTVTGVQTCALPITPGATDAGRARRTSGTPRARRQAAARAGRCGGRAPPRPLCSDPSARRTAARVAPGVVPVAERRARSRCEQATVLVSCQ